MFKKNVFTVWRLFGTPGVSSSYTDTTQKVTAVLEPMDAEFAALTGQAFGKGYKLYISNFNADIEETDRLVLADGRKFDVKGVIKYADNLPRHIEVMAIEAIKQG